MRDYDIKQIIDIIESNPTIRISKHSMDRWFERDIDLVYVEKCLNTLPVAIIKQNLNLFKLLYPHKSKKLDIAVVIDVNDYCEIEIVTIFESALSYRVR